MSLGISVFLLINQIKNRNINLKSFNLNRHIQRSSSLDVAFVQAKKDRSNLNVNLVVFNPSNIGCVIKSVTIYKRRKANSFIEKFTHQNYWERLTSVNWWPTNNPDCIKEKYMSDEYRNLYFDNYRDILVRIRNGSFKKNYKFLIKTNLGMCSIETSMSEGQVYFSQWHEQMYVD